MKTLDLIGKIFGFVFGMIVTFVLLDMGYLMLTVSENMPTTIFGILLLSAGASIFLVVLSNVTTK